MLTNQEIDEKAAQFCGMGGVEDYRSFARAIEAEVRAESQEPVAFHLNEESAKFLADMITSGDEPVEITLRVGFIKDDDGKVEYGLLVEESEYPEEGASLLVAIPAPHPPAPCLTCQQAAEKSLEVCGLYQSDIDALQAKVAELEAACKLALATMDGAIEDWQKSESKVAEQAERIAELEQFHERAFEAHPNLDLDVAAIAAQKGGV